MANNSSPLPVIVLGPGLYWRQSSPNTVDTLHRCRQGGPGAGDAAGASYWGQSNYNLYFKYRKADQCRGWTAPCLAELLLPVWIAREIILDDYYYAFVVCCGWVDGWMARVFNAPCRLFLMHTSAVDTLVDRGGMEGSERAKGGLLLGRRKGRTTGAAAGGVVALVGWLAGWMVSRRFYRSARSVHG